MLNLVTKIFFKGSYYYLMFGIAKEWCKGMKGMGEAQETDKSLIKPIGIYGYEMIKYGITGLVLKDIATIGGIIPKEVVSVSTKSIPVITKIFPWL